jgi:outer membrane autotransporter protein
VDIYGGEFGADYTWVSDEQRATLGLFVGTARADQDFDATTSTGKSDLLGGGVYGAWLTDSGWFVNATLSLLQYKNSFDSIDGSLNHTTGDYKDRGFGVTAEAGRRIAITDKGWFVEPAVQGAIVRIARDDYSLGGGNQDTENLSVHGSNTTVSRIRGAIRAGRAWKSDAMGWLEIAARVGATRESSTGGEVIIGSATRWRPNLDGNRYEAGASFYWRPKANFGQFYLDYEYAAGDNFNKPWGVSLGFRLSL